MKAELLIFNEFQGCMAELLSNLDNAVDESILIDLPRFSERSPQALILLLCP